MKKDIKLDWNFKWSMLNDLCRVSWVQGLGVKVTSDVT